MSNAVPSHDLVPLFFADELMRPVSRRSSAAVCKRLVDLSIAVAALAFLWPLLLAIALAVRLSDGGPAIFGQTRVGRNGRPFTCLKFRSMVLNAEEALKEHLERSPEAQLEWRQSQKLTDDPRITSLGHFLRKTSLDELPQLLNILSGEMSLVGPRPIVPAEIERYGEYFAQCFSMPPGLTGLWQVSGRQCAYSMRVTLDSRYAADWSLWLDVEILAKTVPVVLAQRGSR